MQYLLIFLWTAFIFADTNAQTLKATLPHPSAKQLAWHKLEYYWFIHFGPSVFTSNGREKDFFLPDSLDCRQWARVAKAAGAKGLIITAKHHDGFCLWPSKFSDYTVREIAWKNGKGDVLKELKMACKEYGLKLGVYLSPWDKHDPKYGTAAYNDVFVNMMKELATNYGPFFEFWWDGANGEGPEGKKQVYDFNRFRQTMKMYAPNTIVFSDIGPDIRWAGNEKGTAGKTNWNYLDTAGFKMGAGAPPADTLNQGNVNGKSYIPAEVDVSIRPNWFYRKDQDDKVKTPEELFDLYLKSVGRGANLLLNVPPGPDGRIHIADSVATTGFAALLKESFSKNLSLNASKEVHYKMVVYPSKKFADGKAETSESLNDYQSGSFWIKFGQETKLNCIVLSENLSRGQRVAAGKLVLLKGTDIVKEIPFTTIGNKRILSFPAEQVSTIRLVITESKGAPVINEIASFLINENLVEK